MEGPSSLCFVSHAVNMICLTSFCFPKLMTGSRAEILHCTCSLTPLHSYSTDNKEKLLQQLQKHQSFKKRLELTLLPLILCLYKFCLLSCVTCTLKSAVMDDSQTSASLALEAGFALEVFIHTDSVGAAAAELSTVTALHGKTCARWYFHLQPP